MSAAPADSTAALLVRRQASFDRQHVQPRTTTFASSVANRFFSDNSLGRQKRLVETTRRRQAKAREKAREQEHRVEQLQLEYDESARLRALRVERELLRMERKLQHAAATYIQYVWRKRRYFARIRAERDRAARCILAAVRLRAHTRTQARQCAALHIQRLWCEHRRHEVLKRARAVVARCVGARVRARRARRVMSATRIQRWVRHIIARRRRRATVVLQRVWRLQLSKKKIARCSRAYRHVKHLAKLERSAKVLQRALARHAAYCRLIRSSELARYPQVMTMIAQVVTSTEASSTLCNDSNSDVQPLRQQLGEALTLSKQLAAHECKLAADVNMLQTRLRDATATLAREREKLERFHALAAHRRAKDDADIALRLHELETQMRRDIRLELERDFEVCRRAQIRERSKQQQLRYESSEPLSAVKKTARTLQQSATVFAVPPHAKVVATSWRTESRTADERLE